MAENLLGQALWIILVLFVAIFYGVVIALKIVPTPAAATLLTVRGGDIHIKRGKLKPQAMQFVTDILAEAGVTKGFIAINSGNRVTFSRHIPPTIHQRLRNVLLNP